MDSAGRPATPNVLVTAFEPYGRWNANSSWLALVELTRDLPVEPKITTRRYPVDYKKVPKLLAEDLAANYDFALHLGQSPGSSSIQLEAFGLNVRSISAAEGNGQFCPLCPDGPAAYRSQLPLENFALRLRGEGIPAAVSHHAGTYLCNATLYWSQHLAQERGLSTLSTFVHLPLDVSQALEEPSPPPSLSASTAARALRLLLASVGDYYHRGLSTV